MKSDKIKKVVFWTLTLTIAAILLMAGAYKFSNSDDLITQWNKWGLLNYKEIIGIAEISGAVLLLIPRTSIYGFLILTFILIGAAVTHISHGEPFFFALGILLALVINQLIIQPKKVKQ